MDNDTVSNFYTASFKMPRYRLALKLPLLLILLGSTNRSGSIL